MVENPNRWRQTRWLLDKHDRGFGLGTAKNKSSKRSGWDLT